MALQLNKTTEHNMSADYWKITRLNLNVPKKIAEVTVSLFKNQSSSTDKKKIGSKMFYLSGSKYLFKPVDQNPVGENPIKTAYDQLKLLVRSEVVDDLYIPGTNTGPNDLIWEDSIDV